MAGTQILAGFTTSRFSNRQTFSEVGQTYFPISAESSVDCP